MNMGTVLKLYRTVAGVSVVALLGLMAGCDRSAKDAPLQGYVEGEYIYIASPLPGTLTQLLVERGGQVETGELLFVQESGSEAASRALAAERLEQGKAQLDDVGKGQRPSEIAALEAQLKQSRVALALSEKELIRQESLAKSNSISEQELDRAKAAHDEDLQRVTKLTADLSTAKLGARSDLVAAAEANVRALQASLDRADWALSQKRQSAPQDGLVFDTLYREGEWVAAGRPVVVLLPPGNIKVRTFVPEARIGTINPGDSVQVRVDGVDEPFVGEVSFISPRAEYTPPIIYSQESREKLVFRIEMVFDPSVAAKLHPGQPVEVKLIP